MIELSPPAPADGLPPSPARPPRIVRIKSTLRYPRFLIQNHAAAEGIFRRWGELALHALVAEHAPGADADTHCFRLVEHGPLAWVDWVDRKGEPPARLMSWFNLDDTWQSLEPEEGLSLLVKALGRGCLECVPDTLAALAECTGLTPLYPGGFLELLKGASPRPPAELTRLAALVRRPRVVGSAIEFTGRYQERVGPAALDVERGTARLETAVTLY